MISMNRYLIGAVACILLTTGCKKSEIEHQNELPQGELIEMALTLPLDQSQSVSRAEPQTTSWREGALEAQITASPIDEPKSKAVDEEKVANVWVLQFNGTEPTAQLIYKLYMPTYVAGSVVPLLKSTTDNRVAIVANTFDAAWGDSFAVGTATWATVSASSKSISTQRDMVIRDGGSTRDYLPMSGTITGKLRGGELNVPLTRTLVKLIINIRSGVDLAATSFQVWLRNVPNATSWLPDTGTGDWPVAPRVIDYPREYVTGITTTSYKTLTYWVPINRRGTVAGTTGITRVTNAPAGATYLQVKYGDIDYMIHLGADFLTDYNLRGNTKYTYSLTFRTDHLGTDSRVTDNRVLGPLVQTPSGNINGAGGAIVISSPSASLGLMWTAMLSNTEGFTLGSVTGSDGASSMPVLVGVNPKGSVRSSTLTATAMWPNNRPTSQITITQDAATFTSTLSPTTNVPPAGGVVKIIITGTPGLTYEITGGDSNFGLVDSYDNSKGGIPPGGSSEVQVRVDPQVKGANVRSSVFSVSCTTPGNDLPGSSVTITQDRGLTDVRVPGYVTFDGDGTGLPAGLYCVGMYGGHDGTRYTKALYVDKRGYDPHDVNPGIGDDPSLVWESNITSGSLTGASSQLDGLYNTNKILKAIESPAARYCNLKGGYLPAFQGQIMVLMGIKNTFPAQWAFSDQSYWSSMEVQPSVALETSTSNSHWCGKGAARLVRCVWEY